MKILRLTKSIWLAAIALFMVSQATFAGDPAISEYDNGPVRSDTLPALAKGEALKRPFVCGTASVAKANDELFTAFQKAKVLLADGRSKGFRCGTEEMAQRNLADGHCQGFATWIAVVASGFLCVFVVWVLLCLRRIPFTTSVALLLGFGLLGLSPPGRLLAAEVTPGVFTNRLAEIASAENAGILTTVREYHKEFDQNHEEVERTVREKLEPALNDAMVNYSPVTMQGLREALHDVGLAVLKEARANIAVCTNMVTGLEQSRGVAMGVRKQSSRARDLWGKEADANRRAFEEAKASAKMEGELLGLLDSAAHVHEWGRTEFDALAKESAKLAVDLGKEREAIEAEKVSWQALEGIAADTAAILRGVSHGRRNIEEVKVVLGNIQKGLGRSREYRKRVGDILRSIPSSYTQAQLEPAPVEEVTATR